MYSTKIFYRPALKNIHLKFGNQIQIVSTQEMPLSHVRFDRDGALSILVDKFSLDFFKASCRAFMQG